jgi:putative oxidoreductase
MICSNGVSAAPPGLRSLCLDPQGSAGDRGHSLHPGLRSVVPLGLDSAPGAHGRTSRQRLDKGGALRRLFSTFAYGWPGAGLLFLRLVAGIVLAAQGLTRLRSGPPILPIILEVVAIAAGILLLAGLWTPLSGALVAIFGFWNALSQPGDPWAHILLGAIGAGLALLGPGRWSVDARLFGWKRIDVRDRNI